jgi:hypothetical protein
MTDLSTLGTTYTYYLYKIPSFEHFQQLRKDGALAIADALLPVITPVFRDEHVELNEKYFDTYYSRAVAQVLKTIDADSFAYKYLALTRDFQVIRQLYIRRRAEAAAEYASAVKQEIGQLLVPELYMTRLAKEEQHLHNVEDTFEFVNHIDYVYLNVLIDIAEPENTFIHTFVKSKLEMYNVMTVLRLTQMGRAYERIVNLLIDTPHFYSAGILKRLKAGDMLAEVGGLLGLDPKNISVTAIETFLMEKQIRSANQAMFFGVGQERVLQYFTKLHFFIYDIKLILAAHALELPAEQVDERILNYDLV